MYALLILKARRIRNIYKKYLREKQNSIRKLYGKKPKYSFGDRFNHLRIDLKLCLIRCTYLKGTCLHKFCIKLRNDGTLENYILKSIIGFISGIIITFIFFMFFYFTLHFDITTATTMCSIFGSLLTIGLAFSQNVRCIVLMTMPQFFSQKGRQALLAYAFILTLTGPGKNTLLNMGIMSESLACGQEQLRVAGNQVAEMVKKPYYAIRDAVKTVVKSVKEVVNKIKEIFLKIKRIVMSIVRVIKSAFEFLGKIFNICSKKIGTPFERCTRVFETAITDCHAKLGPLFSWLCSIAYIIKSVCYIVKPLDFICMLIDYVNESIIGVILKKVRSFVRHIRTLFYVRINFSHSFQFETTQSKNMNDIMQGIITEIKERCQSLLSIFDFMSAAISFFFTVVIIKAIYYRYKYLTSEKYDNRYITREIREIDLRRAQLRKETILPLNHGEHKIYVEPSTFRLVKIERKRLTRALTLLIVHSFKIFTYIVIDYSMYWMLAMIRYYGSLKTTIETPKVVGLHIAGKGFLADLYKSIVSAFSSFGVKMDVDTVPCLPEPFTPDFYRYYLIGFLVFLCWILALFEPYGLRMRQAIMSYYHPIRSRERAIWLFNQIVRKRQNFLKFARRQLRRKMIHDKSVSKIGCMEWIRSKIDNPFLRSCLGERKQVACLLCGRIFRPSDSEKPIFCWKPGCPGTYCQACFKDLQNKCTICLQPIDYGDLSDMDEEIDSSDDEAQENYRKRKTEKEKKKLKKLFQIKRNAKNSRESNDEETDESKEEEEDKEEDEKKDDDDADNRGGGASGEDFDKDDNGNSKGSTTVKKNSENSDATYKKTVNSKSKKMRQRGGYDTYVDDSAEGAFSYQYGESIPSPETPLRKPFYDLEKQSIPDYVSMEIFSNDFKIEEKNFELESDSVASTVKKFRTKEYETESLPEVHFSIKFNPFHAVIKYLKKYFVKKQKSESEVPLIDWRNSGSDDDNYDNSETPKKSETSFIETLQNKSNRTDYSGTRYHRDDLSDQSKSSGSMDTQISEGCYPRISRIKHFFQNSPYGSSDDNIKKSDTSFLSNLDNESSESIFSINQPSTSKGRNKRKKKIYLSKEKIKQQNSQSYNEFSLRKYYDSEEDKLLPSLEAAKQSLQIQEILIKNSQTVRTQHLFYNVNYHEENESPRIKYSESTSNSGIRRKHSGISEESKRIFSQSENSEFSDNGRSIKLKRSLPSSRSLGNDSQEINNSSNDRSFDSNLFSSSLRRRTRRYYQKINRKNIPYRSIKMKKSLWSKIKDFFSK